jgi:shikimate kinase
MTPPRSNVVLIGMPGSGKSTVGVLLAKETGRGFVDTDVLIQTGQGRTLQDIVDVEGYMALRRIEEETILALSCRNHVIATGGSAAYSRAAMEHLKTDGVTVFLEVRLATLQRRIRNYATRGLAKRPDQSLADLFEERCGLYNRYGDIRVECSDLDQDQTCEAIVRCLADGSGCRPGAGPCGRAGLPADR